MEDAGVEEGVDDGVEVADEAVETEFLRAGLVTSALEEVGVAGELLVEAVLRYQNLSASITGFNWVSLGGLVSPENHWDDSYC